MSIKVLTGLALASLLCAQSLPEIRMLPAEMRGGVVDGNQIGSSGLVGVHTKVLFGDPSKAGFYSILLFVPAHTTIQAHSHRDDRMATVVSGAWHFGYGDRFNAKSLKRLQPGSVYSEPGAHNHFARTGQGRCHRANLGVWSDLHALFQSSRRAEIGKIEARGTPRGMSTN
jgi:hypothetical protein